MSARQAIMIGIDLGTYNSAACFLLGGEPILLRPEEGATEQGMCFPSVVEFDESGQFVQAGERARRSLPIYPRTVVWGVKRLIGRSYEAAKASGDVDRYAFAVEPSPDGGCMIRIGNRSYTPREITARILEKVKHDCEADFNPVGCAVDDAVITVPAYFDPVQKYETEQAALAAGFNNVYLLPEPTAAASAYRLKVEREDQYIVVVDLGAGTLDVTVALLYLDDHGQLQTVEKSHGGDTALGGIDMDDALLRWITKRHSLASLMEDPHAKMRLRTELERAKIALSTGQRADLAFAWAGGPVRLSLTRAELEKAVRPIVERCRGPIRAALQDAGLAPEEIAHVLLVGGPTMMPIVRGAIIDEFRKNPRIVAELKAIESSGFPVHPMEAVARGAVLGVAGKIAPHGYGLTMFQDYFEMFPRRQRYPSRGSRSFTFWGDERTIDFGLVRQTINPDTCREQYHLLGRFQFDLVAEQGFLNFHMEWEYTDNGVLHFEVAQHGGARMPLYDVSRLEGHEIACPQRRDRFGESENAIPAIGDIPVRRRWSVAELQQALRFGERVLVCARQVPDGAAGPRQQEIQELCSSLEGWLRDEAEDANFRTPHIRDLGRALLNLLHVGRLVEPGEIAALRQEL